MRAEAERAAVAEAQLERLRAVAPEALFAAQPAEAQARIRAAQEALLALGYDIGAADGALGGRTAAALGAFQSAAGLPETGALDAATLDALALALALRYAGADAGAATDDAPRVANAGAARDGARGVADLATFRECDACPEMVVIPAGSFTMGSPETEEDRLEFEGPQHEVTIERFAIGRTEVTFAQWAACVADGYCQSNTNPDDLGWGRGDRPVIHVSWDNVTGERGFIDWLNSKVEGEPYRLPSEAEWEYAARAGSETRFSFGNSYAALGDYAWYSANSGLGTHPVGETQPNAFGLYDVHGNVWEWVQDCWHGSYEGAPSDGSAWMEANQGDCSRAVLRGGSWSINPQLLRSANRNWYARVDRHDSIGFRVARTIIPL